MRPQEVVFVEESVQSLAEGSQRGVLVQIDVLVLDRTPEPFDERIVSARPRPSMLMRIWRAFSGARNI